VVFVSQSVGKRLYGSSAQLHLMQAQINFELKTFNI